jgi:hypothetical protein
VRTGSLHKVLWVFLDDVRSQLFGFCVRLYIVFDVFRVDKLTAYIEIPVVLVAVIGSANTVFQISIHKSECTVLVSQVIILN